MQNDWHGALTEQATPQVRVLNPCRQALEALSLPNHSFLLFEVLAVIDVVGAAADFARGGSSRPTSDRPRRLGAG
eukprot:3157990-Alexandrium_andersonii.AAC.1